MFFWTEFENSGHSVKSKTTPKLLFFFDLANMHLLLRIFSSDNSFFSQCLSFMYYSGLPKGRLISEYLFDNLKFSKKNNKKFDKFLS